MARYSVVISVFNKAGYIGKTLQSVLDQTHTDFEIVVVNDGSTDSSESEILAVKDDRIKYYPQENQGAGAGRNAAISKAGCEWIALLDADDRWHTDYLEQIDKMIGEYPKESVFATGVAIEKSGTTIIPNYSVNDLGEDEVRVLDFFKSSYIHSLLTSSSTVVRRSVFDEVGFYDPTIKSGQDTDLWVRVGLEYKVVFLNKVCAVYEYAERSLSKSTRSASQKATFEGYEKYEAERPEVKKFLDLNRFSISLLAKMEGDESTFKKYRNGIDMSNLNSKQRMLIKSPGWILSRLFRLKTYFESKGIYLSAFK